MSIKEPGSTDVCTMHSKETQVTETELKLPIYPESMPEPSRQCANFWKEPTEVTPDIQRVIQMSQTSSEADRNQAARIGQQPATKPNSPPPMEPPRRRCAERDKKLSEMIQDVQRAGQIMEETMLKKTLYETKQNSEGMDLNDISPVVERNPIIETEQKSIIEELEAFIEQSIRKFQTQQIDLPTLTPFRKWTSKLIFIDEKGSNKQKELFPLTGPYLLDNPVATTVPCYVGASLPECTNQRFWSFMYVLLLCPSNHIYLFEINPIFFVQPMLTGDLKGVLQRSVRETRKVGVQVLLELDVSQKVSTPIIFINEQAELRVRNLMDWIVKLHSELKATQIKVHQDTLLTKNQAEETQNQWEMMYHENTRKDQAIQELEKEIQEWKEKCHQCSKDKGREIQQGAVNEDGISQAKLDFTPDLTDKEKVIQKEIIMAIAGDNSKSYWEKTLEKKVWNYFILDELRKVATPEEFKAAVPRMQKEMKVDDRRLRALSSWLMNNVDCQPPDDVLGIQKSKKEIQQWEKQEVQNLNDNGIGAEQGNLGNQIPSREMESTQNARERRYAVVSYLLHLIDLSIDEAETNTAVQTSYEIWTSMMTFIDGDETIREEGYPMVIRPHPVDKTRNALIYAGVSIPLKKNDSGYHQSITTVMIFRQPDKLLLLEIRPPRDYKSSSFWNFKQTLQMFLEEDTKNLDDQTLMGYEATWDVCQPIKFSSGRQELRVKNLMAWVTSQYRELKVMRVRMSQYQPRIDQLEEALKVARSMESKWEGVRENNDVKDRIIQQLKKELQEEKEFSQQQGKKIEENYQSKEYRLTQDHKERMKEWQTTCAQHEQDRNKAIAKLAEVNREAKKDITELTVSSEVLKTTVTKLKHERGHLEIQCSGLQQDLEKMQIETKSLKNQIKNKTGRIMELENEVNKVEQQRKEDDDNNRERQRQQDAQLKQAWDILATTTLTMEKQQKTGEKEKNELKEENQILKQEKAKLQQDLESQRRRFSRPKSTCYHCGGQGHSPKHCWYKEEEIWEEFEEKDQQQVTSKPQGNQQTTSVNVSITAIPTASGTNYDRHQRNPPRKKNTQSNIFAIRPLLTGDEIGQNFGLQGFPAFCTPATKESMARAEQRRKEMLEEGLDLENIRYTKEGYEDYSQMRYCQNGLAGMRENRKRQMEEDLMKEEIQRKKEEGRCKQEEKKRSQVQQEEKMQQENANQSSMLFTSTIPSFPLKDVDLQPSCVMMLIKDDEDTSLARDVTRVPDDMAVCVENKVISTDAEWSQWTDDKPQMLETDQMSPQGIVEEQQNHEDDPPPNDSNEQLRAVFLEEDDMQYPYGTRKNDYTKETLKKVVLITTEDLHQINWKEIMPLCNNEVAGIFKDKNMMNQFQQPLKIKPGIPISLMHESCLTALGYTKEDLQRSTHTSIGIYKKTVAIMGVIQINIQIAESEIHQRFHIIPDEGNNEPPAILGNDFFEMTQPVLDPINKLLCIGNNSTQYGTPKEPYICEVRTTKEICLSPWEEADRIKGELVPNPQMGKLPPVDTTFIVDMKEEEQGNLTSLRIIATICKLDDNKSLRFRIRNHGEGILRIPMNTIVAEASQVSSCIESRQWPEHVVKNAFDGRKEVSQIQQQMDCVKDIKDTINHINWIRSQNREKNVEDPATTPKDIPDTTTTDVKSIFNEYTQCYGCSQSVSTMFTDPFNEEKLMSTIEPDNIHIYAVKPTVKLKSDEPPTPLGIIANATVITNDNFKYMPDPDEPADIPSKPTALDKCDNTLDRGEVKKPVSCLVQPDWTIIPEERRKEIEEMLKDYEGTFAKTTLELGKAKVPPHTIELLPGQDRPIWKKPYRLASVYYDWTQKELADMLMKGLISISNSRYSFPIVVVPKKSMQPRMCVDYRELNKRSKLDAFPLPCCDTVFDLLVGVKYFSSLDMKAGYWQIPILPEHRHRTAFGTPFGLFEFNVMPFGLTNAPATFQRCMSNLLQDFIGHGVFVYIDDILVYTKTLDEHITILKEIFRRLDEVNMKLNAAKCQIFRSEVEYLGHVISTQGMRPNEKLVDTIEKMKPPKTVTENKKFLGMLSFFRRYIPNFATISEPLNKLNRGVKGPVIGTRWGPSQQQAFDVLRSILKKKPVLIYPDNTRPYLLFCDASKSGVSGALCQIDDEDVMHPISFASRTLTQAERVWPEIDIECLAIVWSTEHFRPLILGRTVRIFTDHKPVEPAWSKDPTKIQDRLIRWGMKMAQYHYTIEHLPNLNHVVTDYSHRNPCKWAMENMDNKAQINLLQSGTGTREEGPTVFSDIISCREPSTNSIRFNEKSPRQQLELWYNKLFCDSISGLLMANGCCPTCEVLNDFWKIGSLTTQTNEQPDCGSRRVLYGQPLEVLEPEENDVDDPNRVCEARSETKTEGTSAEQFHTQIINTPLKTLEWKFRSFPHIQRSDPELANIIVLLQQSENDGLQLSKTYDCYELIDECLYLRADNQHDLRLCVPHELTPRLLHLIHKHQLSTILHEQRKFMCRILSKNYYWPTMTNDVNEWIMGCTVCQQLQKSTSKTQETPLRRIAVNIIGPLRKSENGNQFILTFIDLCTQFPIAQAIPVVTIDTVIRAFEESVISVFDQPEELIFYDTAIPLMGLFEGYCTAHNIKIGRDISYRCPTPCSCKPSLQVQCQPDKKLATMINNCLTSTPLTDWDRYLQCALFALRTFSTFTTKEFPYWLTIAQAPFIPLHAMYGLKMPNQSAYPTKCQDDAKEYAQRAGEDAYQMVEKEILDLKHHYDYQAQPKQMEMGDIVWAFNPYDHYGSPLKFHIPWQGPYQITEWFTHYVELSNCYDLTKPKIYRHWNHVKPWHQPLFVSKLESILLHDIPQYVIPTVSEGMVDPVPESWPEFVIGKDLIILLDNPRLSLEKLTSFPALKSQQKVPFSTILRLVLKQRLCDNALEYVSSIIPPQEPEVIANTEFTSKESTESEFHGKAEEVTTELLNLEPIVETNPHQNQSEQEKTPPKPMVPPGIVLEFPLNDNRQSMSGEPRPLSQSREGESIRRYNNCTAIRNVINPSKFPEKADIHYPVVNAFKKPEVTPTTVESTDQPTGTYVYETFIKIPPTSDYWEIEVSLRRKCLLDDMLLVTSTWTGTLEIQIAKKRMTDLGMDPEYAWDISTKVRLLFLQIEKEHQAMEDEQRYQLQERTPTTYIPPHAPRTMKGRQLEKNSVYGGSQPKAEHATLIEPLPTMISNSAKMDDHLQFVQLKLPQQTPEKATLPEVLQTLIQGTDPTTLKKRSVVLRRWDEREIPRTLALLPTFEKKGILSVKPFRDPAILSCGPRTEPVPKAKNKKVQFASPSNAKPIHRPIDNFNAGMTPQVEDEEFQGTWIPCSWEEIFKLNERPPELIHSSKYETGTHLFQQFIKIPPGSPYWNMDENVRRRKLVEHFLFLTSYGITKSQYNETRNNIIELKINKYAIDDVAEIIRRFANERVLDEREEMIREQDRHSFEELLKEPIQKAPENPILIFPTPPSSPIPKDDQLFTMDTETSRSPKVVMTRRELNRRRKFRKSVA